MSPPDDWIEDLDIHPGDHAIAIVTDGSPLSLLPSYNQSGLRASRLCSVVTTKDEQAEVRRKLADGGIDVDDAEKDERLLFIDPMEVGHTEDGWDQDTFFDNLAGFVDQAKAKGTTHIQNSGVANWLLDVGSPEEAIRFEARLNLILERRPISGF